MTVGAGVAVANLLGSKLLEAAGQPATSSGLLARVLIAFALVLLDTFVCMLRIPKYPYEQRRTRFSIPPCSSAIREKRYPKRSSSLHVAFFRRTYQALSRCTPGGFG